MYLTMMKAKLHRATVTQARLDYEGSITIDSDLLDASGILENEKVQIANANNGERFETYVIRGEAGSGIMCLNGAAARRVQVNDKIIVMAYMSIKSSEVRNYKPNIVIIDNDNKIVLVKHKECN